MRGFGFRDTGSAAEDANRRRLEQMSKPTIGLKYYGRV